MKRSASKNSRINFENHAKLEIGSQDGVINITQLHTDTLKYLHRLFAYPQLFTILDEPRKQLHRKVLITKTDAYFEKSPYSLPTIGLEMDSDINMGLDMNPREFLQKLEEIISEVTIFLLEVTMPSTFSENVIQNLSSLFYEDLDRGKRVLAFKGMKYFCEIVKHINVRFTRKAPGLKFDISTGVLTINVEILDVGLENYFNYIRASNIMSEFLEIACADLCNKIKSSHNASMYNLVAELNFSNNSGLEQLEYAQLLSSTYSKLLLFFLIDLNFSLALKMLHETHPSKINSTVLNLSKNHKNKNQLETTFQNG